MRLREKLISAVCALAGSSLLVSCAPEAQACDPVAGTYTPVYVVAGGNCGPMPETKLPLDGGSGGVKTTTVMEFGRNIVTKVVHKGCTISVDQTIQAKSGMVESSMHGDYIEVHNSKQLSGTVHYERFTTTMPQAVECQGVYQATFTRPDSVVAPTMY